MAQYSQLKAMAAITKASFIAQLRSPSSIVFSLIFPVIFISVFGFIGKSITNTYKVTLADNIDKNNIIYQAILKSPQIKVVHYSTPDSLQDAIKKGKIAGQINIEATHNEPPATPYKISLKTGTASNNTWPELLALLNAINARVSDSLYPNRAAAAVVDFNYKRDVQQQRPYRTIDFILPGQLGFSLLNIGVFGVAFIFFGLRTTLVLKRFFATPIKRLYIILGECFARVVFQISMAIIIILGGYYFFNFTLENGVITVINMLVIAFLALLVFMGFGFAISGIAKSESTIPPLSNIVTLPQFILGSTFFPVDVFPKWLQYIAQALPLTHVNNALRSIAFEGQNLWQTRNDILVILVWLVIAYVAAVKFFKWE